MMEKTIQDLEKLVNKEKLDKGDHKIIVHALLCCVNTLVDERKMK